MNYETMADLARQSIHDKEARLIFQDAIDELGLFKEIKEFAGWLVSWCAWPHKTDGSYESRARLSYSAWYAAVLFAGWPEKPWELAMECQLPVYGFATNDRVPGIYLDIRFDEQD